MANEKVPAYNHLTNRIVWVFPCCALGRAVVAGDSARVRALFNEADRQARVLELRSDRAAALDSLIEGITYQRGNQFFVR